MARGRVVGGGPRRGCPSVCAAGARMPRRLGEGRRGCRGWGREGGSGLLSHTVSSSESGGRASARPLGLAVIVSGCSCFFGIQHYIPPQQATTKRCPNPILRLANAELWPSCRLFCTTSLPACMCVWLVSGGALSMHGDLIFCVANVRTSGRVVQLGCWGDRGSRSGTILKACFGS